MTHVAANGPILLATCAAMPGLYSDDRYLLAALTERGIAAEPAVWEDARRDWSAAAACVIRSTWDYSYRRDQFVAWADHVDAQTRLWNSARIVRWNTHKQYLLDLADRHVPAVPTVLLRAGTECALEHLLERQGWRDAVVKAAVAQTGRYAMRVDAAHMEAAQGHLDRLLPYEDMLLQPYVQSVTERGEASLVFIDGEFTHAVRKLGTGGAFLVHDDYGGSVRPTRPSTTQLDVARQALAAVGEPTLYARIDLVADDAGRPMVMECEIVEPELFLRYSPAAVERFVAALERRLV
jgi:glutathione synthase/RimK-type ligase-like ATP-grasp enzyme